MKQHQQRGTVHVLVLVIIVLIGLSILARLDINNTRADHETTIQEHPDAMEANGHRSSTDMPRTDAVR